MPERVDILAEPSKPRLLVFVLLERFTLISFTGAVECLRLANRLSGKPLFEWRLVGMTEAPVQSSARIAIPVDGALPDLPPDATVIVCGGMDVSREATPRLLNWLRRAARRGGAMGGLCTGSYVLARAGLLDGRKATIHWEHQDGFAEDFDEVQLTKAVFAVDGNRFTTAGGTSSIDLMLKLIADGFGEELANAVADQLIYNSIRTDRDTQRLSTPARIGVRHPKLAEVIGMMERNIEEPISPAALAKSVDMSARQLERLFRRYLSRSPKRYYMELRLQKARNLLMQTEMSVINVALASGFASPSHFSKCYRAQYGTTPYRERGSQAEPPPAGHAAPRR